VDGHELKIHLDAFQEETRVKRIKKRQLASTSSIYKGIYNNSSRSRSNFNNNRRYYLFKLMLLRYCVKCYWDFWYN